MRPLCQGKGTPERTGWGSPAPVVFRRNLTRQEKTSQWGTKVHGWLPTYKEVLLSLSQLCSILYPSLLTHMKPLHHSRDMERMENAGKHEGGQEQTGAGPLSSSAENHSTTENQAELEASIKATTGSTTTRQWSYHHCPHHHHPTIKL